MPSLNERRGLPERVDSTSDREACAVGCARYVVHERLRVTTRHGEISGLPALTVPTRRRRRTRVSRSYPDASVLRRTGHACFDAGHAFDGPFGAVPTGSERG